MCVWFYRMLSGGWSRSVRSIFLVTTVPAWWDWNTWKRSWWYGSVLEMQREYSLSWLHCYQSCAHLLVGLLLSKTRMCILFPTVCVWRSGTVVMVFWWRQWAVYRLIFSVSCLSKLSCVIIASSWFLLQLWIPCYEFHVMKEGLLIKCFLISAKSG